MQDMVNSGDYRWLRDTALPTVQLCVRDDRRLHTDPVTRENFRRAVAETVRLLIGHPCICLWTVFNEGWGQFCADELYREVKALDPDRFVDSTSGWFHQKESDVDSLHLYFRKLRLGGLPLPQLLSVSALRALYRDELLPLAEKGLCGAVYTQVSDVEDETNGILTFDRAVQKVPPETLRDVAAALQRAVQ